MAEFNILQAPQIIVPVTFTGRNTIGPQLTMVLPTVLITPSKGIDLISDALATIDLNGEVLADVTTGSFGTMTTPDGQVSPAIANYYDGKGVITLNGVDCGNVSKFTFTAEAKVIDHYSSRFGIKVKDFSFVEEKAAKLAMTLDELTYDNLLIILMGLAV